MKRIIALCTVFSLTLPLVAGSAASAATGASPAKAAATNPADVSAVQSQVESIGKYLAAGDVESLGALWTTDAVYVDDSGNAFNGKDALKKRFSNVLAVEGKPSVALKPEMTKLLSNSVAMTQGTVVRQDGSGKSIPETRFSMVLEKQAGKWLIASATETPIAVAPNPPATLKDLDWMIGDWKAEKNGGSLKLHVDYLGDKKFIRFNAQIQRPGMPLQEDTDIIGFDPRTGQLVSWSFDSTTGTFGQGTWSKDGQKWQVLKAQTAPDGTNLTARNIIMAKDNDHFTWQSVDRTAAGLPLSDTLELQIERAK